MRTLNVYSRSSKKASFLPIKNSGHKDTGAAKIEIIVTSYQIVVISGITLRFPYKAHVAQR